MKRLLFFLLIGSFTVSSYAVDFGLLAEQTAELDQDTTVSYTARLTPWFSSGINEKVQLYFSGSAVFEYEDDTWRPLPLFELSRFEIIYRPVQGTLIEAGRIRFSDVSGLIASGLFDGLSGELPLGPGRLNLGVYYTGLLYKETAEIAMTAEDLVDYGKTWDWDDLGAYFAPKRAIANATYTIPGILGPLNNLSLEGIAQLDVSSHDNLLQSQYFEIKYDFFPLQKLEAGLGAILEGVEYADEPFRAAFAGFADTRIYLPGFVNQSISLGAAFSSGNWNQTFGGFTPINGHPRGMVFTPKFSSLAVFTIGHKARLHETLSTDIAARYFMRTDTDSFYVDSDAGSDAYFLGAELFGSVLWAPLDDVSLTLGGGAFFPKAGNVFASDMPVQWKLSTGLILSF